MNTDLHQAEFNGALLTRGFWLYVWEINVSDGRTLHYIGKTGDKASGVSQSPFDRLSKHLGHNENNNALRRYLRRTGIEPESCRLRFTACGPLFPATSTANHGELCDIMSGVEKALADALRKSGYDVLNPVPCHKDLDRKCWNRVRAAFAEYFPRLSQPPSQRKAKA